jgi:hypothetical protein
LAAFFHVEKVMAAKPLYDPHDVGAQVDALRTVVRAMWRRHGTVPPELDENLDWYWHVKEAARLQKEAEAAAAQAEQAKKALDASKVRAKEVGTAKHPAQLAAEQAISRAEADLEAKQRVADEAAAAAKQAAAAAPKK